MFQQNKAALAETADSPAKKKAEAVFNMVNAGQWILILIVRNVLVNLKHPEWFFANWTSLYFSFDFPGTVQTKQIYFELGTGLGTSAFGLDNLGQVVG